jgi:hypothetical protein
MIVQNAVICNKCDDYIFSKHRHDFVQCKCGNIFVDGGQEYLRRGGHGLTDRSYVDLSWSIEDDIYNDCAAVVEEALATGRNRFGIANAVLRKLRSRDRVIGEDEQRIMAYNAQLDEVMVVEPDGTVNRYKKVEE